MTLPPLPETGERSPTDCSPLFTAAQMQAYAQAAVQAEREACAKVCDDIGPGEEYCCAQRIRARGE